MGDTARARRLAVRIREIVATTLEMQVKDPRLGLVTVTDARLTPDLRDATVFYTVYGDEAERQSSAMALESARGVLRSEVGRQTGVKFTPTLTFVADVIPDSVRHIDDLVARARASDEEVARAREGAAYAGEPDPYRTSAADADADADADAGEGADGRGLVAGPPAGSRSAAGGGLGVADGEAGRSGIAGADGAGWRPVPAGDQS